MGEVTKIEWCDATFNPWIGCSRVSTGCKNCYAENMMDKRYGRVKWGPNGTRSRTSEAYWRKPLAWNRKAGENGTRPRVFCASLADVFEDRPELVEWRADLFDLIRITPNLDWLLLTKRPENVLPMIDEIVHMPERNYSQYDFMSSGGVPANVWLGTSVENQETANQRIPTLMRIPAAVRFLSMEPLLGSVDLREALELEMKFPDWVIVGGESGPNARPMQPDWARSLRDQCQGDDIPFFFKQWGAWRPADAWESTPGNVGPENLGRFYGTAEKHATSEVLVRVDKKSAGRVLDGKTWSEFPKIN